MKAFFKWLLGGLALMFLVLFLGLYLWARSHLPDYEGRVFAEPLAADVEILRDSYGMPHIYAQNERDLYFGFGYAMAQDRLFQMDLMRRAVAGRLAEVLGAKLIKIDRFFRTITAVKDIRALESEFPDEIVQIFKVFTRGINHFIQTGPLPLEFTLLGYKPEPWHYTDGMSMHYYMAWVLNSAFYVELFCSLLVEKFGIRKARTLCSNSPPFIAGSSAVSDEGHSNDALRSFLLADLRAREFFQTESWGASNAWVISGKRSKSAGPLLASDMHLGYSLPGIWYEAHLVSPGQNVSGVVLPGVPFVIVGATPHVAWAFTNAMADDSDFYYETLDPQDPERYLLGNRFVDMRIIDQKIRVKEGQDIPFTIRLTRHGPIINTIYGSAGKPESKLKRALAMRWTAYEHYLAALALYKLNRAKNINDVEAASEYFKVPGQNWIYADGEGNIGYTLAACIPERKGFNGSLPVDGASGRYEWGPCLPLHKQLRRRNPPQGWIASANQRLSYYLQPLSHYNAPPDRFLRIRQMLTGKKKLSSRDFQSIHSDLKILLFHEWRPLFARLPQEGLDAIEAEALQSLLAWDGVARLKGDSGATVFFVLWTHLLQDLFGAHLTKTELELYFKVAEMPIHALRSFMQEEDNSWFDDPATPKKERRTDLILKSLRSSVAYLKTKLGKEPANWDWGRLHTLSFQHPFGRSSAFLDWLLSRGPYPVGGGRLSVNPMGFHFLRPYRVTAGASMRHIVDLSDPDNSLRILPTGVSGNFMSPHYDDQIQNYLSGQYRPHVFSRRKVIADAQHRLLLTPSRD